MRPESEDIRLALPWSSIFRILLAAALAIVICSALFLMLFAKQIEKGDLARQDLITIGANVTAYQQSHWQEEGVYTDSLSELMKNSQTLEQAVTARSLEKQSIKTSGGQRSVVMQFVTWAGHGQSRVTIELSAGQATRVECRTGNDSSCDVELMAALSSY